MIDRPVMARRLPRSSPSRRDHLPASAHQIYIAPFRELQVIEGMRPGGRLCFAGFQQPFGGVLADDVEHVVASLGVFFHEYDQTLVDQVAHDSQGILDTTYGFGRRQAQAAREDCQPPEELAFGFEEQVVAPRNSLSDGALARWQVERARSAAQARFSWPASARTGMCLTRAAASSIARGNRRADGRCPLPLPGHSRLRLRSAREPNSRRRVERRQGEPVLAMNGRRGSWSGTRPGVPEP